MKFDKLSLLLTYVVLLNLNACNGFTTAQTSTPMPIPPTATNTIVPISTETIESTATVSLSPTPKTTSTEWLPYNPNISDKGCSEFTATIPIKDAKKLSKEEIIKKLFEMYLEHFKSPDLGGICRLEEFKIENIKMDQIVAFTAKNQWVETTAWVDYSIKIKEVPSNWIAANGELAPDGWIIHKSLIIGFIESDEQYVLILVGGP